MWLILQHVVLCGGGCKIVVNGMAGLNVLGPEILAQRDQAGYTDGVIDMETKTGQLYDLDADGLGFIVESSEDRKWAFHFPDTGSELAADLAGFVMLEGEAVRFTIDAKRRVESIVRVRGIAR